MSIQPASESLPILPILDTEEILNAMGSEWGYPANDHRHGVAQVDHISLQWIGFCEFAKRGYKLVHSQTLSGDLMSLRSSRAFMDSLASEDVQFPEIITTIESAFAQLLSAKAQKKILNLDLQTDLQVDVMLRNQIGVLVSNMSWITNHYIAERRSERNKFYRDDD